MNPKKLDDIRKRILATTPGPWSFNRHNEILTQRGALLAQTATGVDAEFIACAREDVEELVTEVERLNNQPIIKHFCNAVFIDEYPMSTILEPEKSLAHGTLFTFKDQEYLILNIMIRSATEIVVETKRI